MNADELAKIDVCRESALHARKVPFFGDDFAITLSRSRKSKIQIIKRVI